MKFTKVEKIPRRYHKLQSELRDFMDLNTKIVKVEWFEGEYVNSRSAAASLYKAAKVGGFPIKVESRKDEVYLTRTDM